MSVTPQVTLYRCDLSTTSISLQFSVRPLRCRILTPPQAGGGGHRPWEQSIAMVRNREGSKLPILSGTRPGSTVRRAGFLHVLRYAIRKPGRKCLPSTRHTRDTAPTSKAVQSGVFEQNRRPDISRRDVGATRPRRARTVPLCRRSSPPREGRQPKARTQRPPTNSTSPAFREQASPRIAPESKQLAHFIGVASPI